MKLRNRCWRCFGRVVAGVALPSRSPSTSPCCPTPELQQRYEALTHELRCMQCQNNSIADSPVGLAVGPASRREGTALAGKTDDEIRAYMVQRYGNVILFTPPFDAVVRLGVGAAGRSLLLGGVIIAVRIVRQRARAGGQRRQRGRRRRT